MSHACAQVLTSLGQRESATLPWGSRAAGGDGLRDVDRRGHQLGHRDSGGSEGLWVI